MLSRQADNPLNKILLIRGMKYDNIKSFRFFYFIYKFINDHLIPIMERWQHGRTVNDNRRKEKHPNKKYESKGDKNCFQPFYPLIFFLCHLFSSVPSILSTLYFIIPNPVW